LLALSKIIPNITTYFVCSNENAYEERLGQLKHLGMTPTISYMTNLEAVQNYMKKKGFNIKGVINKKEIYLFK